jgi:hypothetical protein
MTSAEEMNKKVFYAISVRSGATDLRRTFVTTPTSTHPTVLYSTVKYHGKDFRAPSCSCTLHYF